MIRLAPYERSRQPSSRAAECGFSNIVECQHTGSGSFDIYKSGRVGKSYRTSDGQLGRFDMPAIPAIMAIAMVAGTTTAIVEGVQSAAASKKAAENANDQALGLIGSQGTTVANESTSDVNNLGSAALIGTSPLGVQGTDASQRYRLLGN